MDSDRTYYYSKKIPDAVKSEFLRLGYKFKDIESYHTEVDLIKDNLNIIWYERDIDLIIKNIDLINNGQQKNVLIVDHHFQQHSNIQRLDELIKENRLTILGTQETLNLYSKIKCYAMNSSELWCHHDFIYYMIKKWHKQRQPVEESLFLFMPAVKDLERQRFIDEIKNALRGELLELPAIAASELYKKRDELDSWIKNTFDGANMLGGFGNGTPRFDLYDRVFAEIVIETVYDTPTIHITEKTWKPIACGVPGILILNPANIYYLRSLGYQLYPTDFYDKLADTTDIKQAVQLLLDLSGRLKQDDALKEKFKETAVTNYKKFWEVKSYWEAGLEGCSAVFGFDPVMELEDKLKNI